MQITKIRNHIIAFIGNVVRNIGQIKKNEQNSNCLTSTKPRHNSMNDLTFWKLTASPIAILFPSGEIATQVTLHKNFKCSCSQILF